MARMLMLVAGLSLVTARGLALAEAPKSATSAFSRPIMASKSPRVATAAASGFVDTALLKAVDERNAAYAEVTRLKGKLAESDFALAQATGELAAAVAEKAKPSPALVAATPFAPPVTPPTVPPAVPEWRPLAGSPGVEIYGTEVDGVFRYTHTRGVAYYAPQAQYQATSACQPGTSCYRASRR